MKIAKNGFRLDIRPVIFAFDVILQLLGTFLGISFLTPSNTGFMFGLISSTVTKNTSYERLKTILSQKNNGVALT